MSHTTLHVVVLWLHATLQAQPEVVDAQQPVVVAALDKLWSAANFDDSDAIIDNKEDIVMQGSWYTSSLALGIGLLFDPMGP